MCEINVTLYHNYANNFPQLTIKTINQ